VAGAPQGEGLGNHILGHNPEGGAPPPAGGGFANKDVTYPPHPPDPPPGIGNINKQPGPAPLDVGERALQRAAKAAKTNDKEAVARRDMLERLKQHLNDGKPARALAFTDAEKPLLRELHLLTHKPVMYIANVAENGFTNNPHLAAVE